MKEYKMPYKGFDINKDEEKRDMIDRALNRQLDSMINILNYVRENFSESDYKLLVAELLEELGV
jgi:hypothetical protein